MTVINFIGGTYKVILGPINKRTNTRPITEKHIIKKIQISTSSYIEYNNTSNKYILYGKNDFDSYEIIGNVEDILTRVKFLLNINGNTGSIQFNYKDGTTKIISIDATAINNFSMDETKLVYTYKYIDRTEATLPDFGGTESDDTESDDTESDDTESDDTESDDTESVNIIGEAAIKLMTEQFTQFKIAKGYNNSGFTLAQFTEFTNYKVNEAAKMQAKYNMLNGELKKLKDSEITAKWVARSVSVEVTEEDSK